MQTPFSEQNTIIFNIDTKNQKVVVGEKIKEKAGVNRGPGNERIGEQKRSRGRQFIETEGEKHKMKNIMQVYFYTNMKYSFWWLCKQL